MHIGLHSLASGTHFRLSLHCKSSHAFLSRSPFILLEP